MLYDYYLSYPARPRDACTRLSMTLKQLGALRVSECCYYIQSSLDLNTMLRYLKQTIEPDDSAHLIHMLKVCGMTHARIF